MKTLNYIIEELIYYAKVHLDLNDLDVVYVRNRLLDRLNEDEPYYGEIDKNWIASLSVPDVLLSELKSSLLSNGMENVDLIVTEVMGLLTPMPSYVNYKVASLEKHEKGLGLDYLYNLEIKNNYIQKSAIDKNIYFRKDYDDNFLEITINLSKPEKNNKDIAKLLVNPNVVKYPKCLLCQENLGYKGRIDHPARENLRIISLILNNEDWFLQYSPYAYFDHHAIIINKDHHNMTINDCTFIKLLEFVDLYPTFFIGSNADLPIVGGSILDHEHYQGGLHLLPVFYSKDREVLYQNDNIKISILNWYNSVIKIEGKEQSFVNEFSKKIFHTWKDYNDETIDIISSTNGERHNTITPIARKENNVYSMYLILRNNRCDEIHPEGIFHAHKKYHHIKKEGIGLIEAMGLFILPPRLKRQMEYIEELLQNNNDLNCYFEKYTDLKIHQGMIKFLIDKYGRNLSQEKAHSVINDFIADTCKNILCNTAVFKNDNKGQKSFIKFLNTALNK